MGKEGKEGGLKAKQGEVRGGGGVGMEQGGRRGRVCSLRALDYCMRMVT